MPFHIFQNFLFSFFKFSPSAKFWGLNGNFFRVLLYHMLYYEMLYGYEWFWIPVAQPYVTHNIIHTETCLNWSQLVIVTIVVIKLSHNYVMTWKSFLHYWPFMRECHQSLMHPPHKGQQCRALMFSLMLAWRNWWINSWVVGVIWKAMMLMGRLCNVYPFMMCDDFFSIAIKYERICVVLWS